ncbi:MAG: LysR family transcriptional regulator [Sphaerochaetaceae bacterium]|jgi:DNA-binding transcriptional LysR family regulator|nr:LysR family transcriptional regulator [Sphaerochaetaceae bacterium]MDD3163399.1 LysR family transcriptional regulator [Sphaerochaetaceae bacterium]MDD4008010.1 LysR family transcriptional regulator [Sphaerochaetaceae bacterium]MDD4396555.1 LysR family transcriptional regulator [Sphaerochaetaceae bacterium]
MNLLHLRYAVEVARCRSISKAAENLSMGQPNLSRSIKELEDSIGITIFNRTTKGMAITAQGEEFIQYAREIISRVDYVESLYRKDDSRKQVFSISVPRASYISHAFVEFSAKLNQNKMIGVWYKETNSLLAMSSITDEDYNLGIIRYCEDYDSYFKGSLREKGLDSKELLDFTSIAVMSDDHPLAGRQDLGMSDFEPYPEVVQGDPYIPSLPVPEIRKAAFDEGGDKHLFIFDRGSQFDLLCGLKNSYMWVSPIPEVMLKRYHLVQKWVPDNDKVYKDVLIYRKGYRFTDLDKLFLDTLMEVKQNLQVII